MGQQQLLLIVLGSIVVGMAMYTAVRLADTIQKDNNRDQMILQISTIDMYARQYAMKPTSLGGGGRSFAGFTIPDNMQNTSTGRFVGFQLGQQYLVLGYGTEKGKDNESSTLVYGWVYLNQPTQYGILN